MEVKSRADISEKNTSRKRKCETANDYRVLDATDIERGEMHRLNRTIKSFPSKLNAITRVFFNKIIFIVRMNKYICIIAQCKFSDHCDISFDISLYIQTKNSTCFIGYNTSLTKAFE